MKPFIFYLPCIIDRARAPICDIYSYPCPCLYLQPLSISVLRKQRCAVLRNTMRNRAEQATMCRAKKYTSPSVQKLTPRHIIPYPCKSSAPCKLSIPYYTLFLFLLFFLCIFASFVNLSQTYEHVSLLQDVSSIFLCRSQS